MAVLAWVLGAASLVAFAVAGFVLARHWSEIRLIDPQSIKDEVERQKRNELLEMRLKRLQEGKTAPIRYVFQRTMLAGKKSFHAAYLHLIRLNRYYEQAKRPFAKVAPSVQERIKLLLDEARSLARDLKWAEAESRFLEVLCVDNRNAEAYKGVGAIYLRQKQYAQARETFEYLVKTKQADDVAYAALADIAEAEGNLPLVEQMRIKAVEVRPRLANRHAELARFYLERGDTAKAWPSIQHAVEFDSKSPKYQELALEIALRIGDIAESRRRYDKLRLLTDDRQRLQKYRERMDALRVG